MSVFTSYRTAVLILSAMAVFGGCHSGESASSYPTERVATSTSDAGSNPCPDGGGVEEMDALPCGTIPHETPMEEHTLALGIAGLWTNVNSGTAAPPGALEKADDIEIDQPGKARPRRNMDVADTGGSSLPAENVQAAFDYNGTTITWDGEGLDFATIATGSSPTVNYFGRNEFAWSGDHFGHATAGGDLYVTSDEGPLVLDGLVAPRQPGVPRAYDLTEMSIALTFSASGWLSDTGAAAYRIVWGYNDAEGRPVLGEPSGRYAIYGEAGGPWTVQITVRPPPGITTTSGHFFQVYRTQPLTTAADPGDTMFLVWEQPYTSGSSVIVKDVDPFGDAPLYTNPERGGIGSSNVRPAKAGDLTPFRERLWLANTTSPQRLRIRFIAPPDPFAGHTVVINGRGYVLDVPSGTTVSQKIESAARWLIQNVNLLDDDIQAIYASGPYDPPGIVEFVAFSPIKAAFTAKTNIGGATAGAYFVPNLTEAVSSRADTYKNRLHFSRFGLPYAFPLPNTLQVGAEEHAISRIAALKDTLFAFKGLGGDGLWKVTGSGPFYVESVNPNLALLAPNALVVAGSSIIALTNQGLVQVTEANVDVIDLPIQDKIKAIIDMGRADGVRLIARQENTEAKVYVGLPGADGWVAESYVYNLNTETWTRDTREWTAGYVLPTNQLALWEPNTRTLQVERNTGNRAADSEGVPFRIAWLPDMTGAPGTLKQFVRVTFLFEEVQPAVVDAQVEFTADDGSQGPVVHTGGEGTPYIRAEVPFDQQRTSRLGVQLYMEATGNHNILGLELRYKQASGLVGVTGQ